MTGFATKQLALPHGTLSVELRAVNHRYLDIQLRLPEELRIVEPLIREAFVGKVLRGKIECRITMNTHEQAAGTLQLNAEFLQQLVSLSKEAKQYAPHAGELPMGELLRWPGVLISHALPIETLQNHTLALLQEALLEFIASRQREGKKLAQELEERIAKMETLLTDIRPHLPLILKQYEDKLTQRFLDALQTVEDERIRQEIVLFAQKIDIEEELARLATHLDEARRVLKSHDQGVGKRLDFLMQELNREANTLGSKSVSIETSQASINLKVLIEQMREQIQNIE
jgi:uncharacterized protein (TIGR00255 family)